MHRGAAAADAHRDVARLDHDPAGTWSDVRPTVGGCCPSARESGAPAALRGKAGNMTTGVR